MADSKGDSVEKVPETPSMPLVTSEERQMANSATELFEKRSYDQCLKTLKQLSEKRGPDPRVMLNMAVLDFYKSGQSNTEEFRKALLQASAKAQVTVENINALDDVDQCVFYYNHAVLLYHQRQYKTALAIMDKLIQFVEPMEDGLTRRVAFLLVELYLCMQQPENALRTLNFMEKTLFGNGKNSQTSNEKDGKDSGKDKKDDGKEKEGSAESPGDQWKLKLSLLRARCYTMLRSLKQYKREVKTLMGLAPSATPTCFLKGHFDYIRGHYRKAIKQLNSAPQPGRSPSETGENLSMMHFNNMAAIHFYMAKPNLAAFYLRKSMQENERVARDFNKPEHLNTLSGRPLQTIGISRHYELLYNTGLTMLHCGKPEAAFECLNQVIHMYRINPRLWLRLAECCIMVYKKDNDEDRQLSKHLEVIQGSVGSGVHRKLILGPGLKHSRILTESPTMPALTLEYASLCLKNALSLLPEDSLDAVPPSGDDPEPQRPPGDLLVAAPPGSPLKQQEVANLRSSILLSSSYVALCLNDYIVARNFAEKLLKQPRLSGVQKYLGHMYLAEALVAVDKIADAIGHLNPENVADISLTPPESKQDAEKMDKNGDKENDNGGAKGSLYPWTPRDLPRAKAVMQYNLSTAHAIRGEFEKALMHLGKSFNTIGLPLPAQMYFLKIYLELMEGRRKQAHAIIKDHFGHVTPNRV